MSKIRIAVFSVALLVFVATFGFAMAVPAPVVAPQSTTIVAESQANTVAAQRQELKDEIVRNSTKAVGKTVTAAKKLLGFENADDVIYLINMMIQNQKSPLAKEIQKAILSYERKDYLVIALKKAGQDQSTDVNIVAANLLIDMKEELEGLKVMVSLIKKGVMTSQVIDIMDRVPERQKLYGIKASAGQIIYNNEIQQALQTIYRTDVFPKDVQVFALLMQAAYYGTYLNNDRPKISNVLNEAEQTYAHNAINLLQKAVDLRGEAWGTSWEIIKELAKSRIPEVALKAKKIDELLEKSRKGEWRKIISNGNADNLNKRQDMVIRYLFEFGDTIEEVKYLIDLFKNDKNENIKIQVINALGGSKHNEIIVPTLIKEASDVNIRVENQIILFLLNNGYEQDSLFLLKKSIEKICKSKDEIGFNPFYSFKQEIVKRAASEYLYEIISSEICSNKIRTFACINLLKINNPKKDIFILLEGTLNEEEISEKEAWVMMRELSDAAAINQEQRKQIIAIIQNAINSANKNVAYVAKQELENMEKYYWWK